MDPVIFHIENPLECTVIGRKNRFVVEVRVDGRPGTACINNTGRLNDYLYEGNQGFCIRNPERLKTDYRLFALQESGRGAIIDTRMQMQAFERALTLGLVPWVEGYSLRKRDARLDGSLIDYLLDPAGGGAPAYLEVKSAVLREGRCAMYPDCPTARGRRHVRDLIRLRETGGRAFITFIAALPEVEAFKPYEGGDLELCALLREARGAGVEIRALAFYYEPADGSLRLYNADLPVMLA